MDESDDALFSLELFVEKLCLPHLTCRFPAVAFRLLDFPTITINHVEDELADVIRQKMSLESSGQIPQQFVELKDRHGNFMVKKGKSCLFRMAPNNLKQHLISTPLYVMVIDQYPKIPKLLGSTSIHLDGLINLILSDHTKMGPTLPSAHGDKGLFKLSNLMGVEVGYAVFGYRLLCVGSGLLSHFHGNQSVLLKNLPVQQVQVQESIIQKNTIQQVHAKSDYNGTRKTNGDKDGALNVQSANDASSLIEPTKRDACLQTQELEANGRAACVDIMVATDDFDTPNQNPIGYTVSTQTERKKHFKEFHNDKIRLATELEEEDEIASFIPSNVIRPPPLFFSCYGTPPVQIERNRHTYDDLSTECSSDESVVEKENLNKVAVTNQTKPMHKIRSPVPTKAKHTVKYDESGIHSPSYQPPKQSLSSQIRAVNNDKTLYPLLSALYKELSCIQNLSPLDRKEIAETNDTKFNEPSILAAVAKSLSEKMGQEQKDISKNKVTNKGDVSKKQLNINSVSKENKPLKEVAKNPKQKKKLVYGLTNTQRLRLQKVNPAWVKRVDKESGFDKSKIKNEKRHVSEAYENELNASQYSDTLTEVRRLAAKELNRTSDRAKTGGSKSRANLSLKKTHVIKPSVSQRSPILTMQGKVSNDQRELNPLTAGVYTEDSEDQDSEKPVKERPIPQQRHIFGSSLVDDENEDMNDGEDQESVRSDFASSRSRSIEVHLPSAGVVDENAALGVELEKYEDPRFMYSDDDVHDEEREKGMDSPTFFSDDDPLPDPIGGNVEINESYTSTFEKSRYSPSLQFTGTGKSVEVSIDERSEGDDIKQSNARGYDSHGQWFKPTTATSQSFPVLNPQQSDSSPVSSVVHLNNANRMNSSQHSGLPSLSHSKGQIQQMSPSSSTKSQKMRSPQKMPDIESNPTQKKGHGYMTPRSSTSSPIRQTPRSKGHPLGYRPSIHTDSVSSYLPSDPENMMISLSSNSGNYDDSQDLSYGDSKDNSVNEQLPKLIPAGKLGYTIS